jgi:hypothetical protein
MDLTIAKWFSFVLHGAPLCAPMKFHACRVGFQGFAPSG